MQQNIYQCEGIIDLHLQNKSFPLLTGHTHRPSLRLQGSYYHVINLFRIIRAAKTRERSKVSAQTLQHEGWPIKMKGHAQICLPVFKHLLDTYCSIHLSVLNSNSMQGQLLIIVNIKKLLYSIRKRHFENINTPAKHLVCVGSRETDCRWG